MRQDIQILESTSALNQISIICDLLCAFCGQKKPSGELMTGSTSSEGYQTFLCKEHMDGRWQMKWIRSILSDKTDQLQRGGNGYSSGTTKLTV